MTDDSTKPKKLSLSGSKLTLSNIDASKLRAGPSVGGARKTVQVEVRRKRAPAAPQRGGTTAPEPVVAEPVQTVAAPAPSTPATDDRLTAQERAARLNLLNCRKLKLVKSVVVAKKTKNILMRMQHAVRLRKKRQAVRRQWPINLVQRQPKCKIAVAAKLKKWHHAAQHHAAKLWVAANQVK